MTDSAVLSIDVELFSQTPAYRNTEGETDREGVGLAGIEYLRETLTARGASSTCFVVSSVADRYPGPIRDLAAAGFEIGSHTHTHRLLSGLDRDERREELTRSKRILERVTDQRVSGFRAPAFDFEPGHFADLDAAGYAYDSSVVASRWIPGWYGGEHDLHEPAPASAVEPEAPDSITELPTSVMPGLRLPLTGTWLRFFGPRYTILGMNRLAKRGITPVLYVHPWEFVDLPAVDGVPNRVYFRTGDWMRRAVERILDQSFEFTTAGDVVERATVGDGTATAVDDATATAVDDATATAVDDGTTAAKEDRGQR
ncbi:MAG: polysaccharide deacetylase family protein [Halopenitus sp.]